MQHLMEYFSQFNLRVSDGGYHRFINPLDRSRNRNMVVNFQYNFVSDWKTGYYNSIAGFISEYSGFSLFDAQQFVGHIDIPILSGNISPSKFDDVEKISGTKLPDHWVTLLDNSMLGLRCREYLQGRGFDIDRLDDEGWGFCNDGEWLGRIIIPYKVKGKLVYYTGRSFIGAELKYKNPKTEEVGIGKSEIFFNQDALYRFTEGWMVEGAIDAQTIGRNAIAASGWKLSTSQISLVANSRWKILNIIPDRGFELKATATGLFFTPYMKVFIHKIPEGAKDVNDCGINNVILNPNSL